MNLGEHDLVGLALFCNVNANLTRVIQLLQEIILMKKVPCVLVFSQVVVANKAGIANQGVPATLVGTIQGTKSFASEGDNEVAAMFNNMQPHIFHAKAKSQKGCNQYFFTKVEGICIACNRPQTLYIPLKRVGLGESSQPTT